jgi:undecaprenyl-diphosphatase
MPPSPLQRLLHWLGGHQKATLAGLCLVSLALWAFVELAGGVTGGTVGTFDQRLLLALRSPLDPTDPLGPPWFEEMARDVTALGGMGILVFLTLAVAGYLILRGRRGLALYTLVAVGSGIGMSFLLKALFQRPRPDLVPHATAVYTSSFPSAHAMASAVVFLTLGGMLARIQPRRRLQGYILLVAAFLTASVGLSRVYLGVHWPTDVLGGWAAGAAWATAGWLILERLQGRGGVEGGEGREAR